MYFILRKIVSFFAIIAILASNFAFINLSSADELDNGRIQGCTDPIADNYDATAQEDDGSCTYPEPEPELCEEEGATNFGGPLPCVHPIPEPVCEDILANNIGSPLPCTYDPVVPELCEDEGATNFGGALPCEFAPEPEICDQDVCEDECDQDECPEDTGTGSTGTGSMGGGGDVCDQDECPEEMEPAPMCNGLTATVYVADGLVVGGPDNGISYAGLLRGTTGDDVMVGTDDADDIQGRLGNDTICGKKGADTISGAAGDDTIFAGRGADTVNAGLDNDTVYGGRGADILNGNGGNDTMYGDEGNDIMNGGLDNDTLYGGDDDDEIYGSDGRDEIRGEKGDDVLNGGLKADEMHGGRGADEMRGSDGNDIMHGGKGKDMMYGQNNKDTMYGGEGNDEMFGGAGQDTMYGDEDDDIINGQDNADQMFGGDGNDAMNGGGGADEMHGNQDNDTMHGQDGADNMYGGRGADTMHGQDGADHMYGRKGADLMYGGNGADYMCGDEGADDIRGQDGADTLCGKEGNDTLFGGNGADIIDGGAGTDSINGQDGNDSCFAGESNSNCETEAEIADGYYCEDEPEIFGCTDPEALNYNSEANIDDDSCEYEEEPEPITAIWGTVFDDYDGNGVLGDGPLELPMSGWEVQLTGSGVFLTGATDENGEYHFEDLVPGEYTICQVVQVNWTQTFPSSGCHDVTIFSEPELETRLISSASAISMVYSRNEHNFGNYYTLRSGGGSGGGGGGSTSSDEEEELADSGDEDEGDSGGTGSGETSGSGSEKALTTFVVEEDPIVTGGETTPEVCPVPANVLDLNYMPDYVSGFNDITDSPYYDQIVQLEKSDIVEGRTSGEYSPEMDLTKAEFLKIMLKSHCYGYADQDASGLEFVDVDNNSWQARVIAKALELGIVMGDKANNFYPDEYITVANAGDIVARLMALKGANEEDIDAIVVSNSSTGVTREYVAALIAAMLSTYVDDGKATDYNSSRSNKNF